MSDSHAAAWLQPTAEPQRRLRVGDRVRATTGDGFVAAGQVGLVLNVIHPGYSGNVGPVPISRVLWDNATSCLYPIAHLALVSAAVLQPVHNTITALSPREAS